MADLWRVTVQCDIDGSTHERTFTAPNISTQVFEGRRPRRTLILCREEAGRVVRSFQCDSWTVDKTRVADDA